MNNEQLAARRRGRPTRAELTAAQIGAALTPETRFWEATRLAAGGAIVVRVPVRIAGEVRVLTYGLGPATAVALRDSLTREVGRG